MARPLPLTTLAGLPAPRLCVVMLTAVGDAVHVLPMVNAIKRQRPGAHLTWVIQRGPSELVRGHPAIDDLIVFERQHGMRGFAEVRAELARRAFDAVLLLQPYLKAGLIASMAPAPIRVGIDRARAQDLTWLFTPVRLPARPLGHIPDQ